MREAAPSGYPMRVFELDDPVRCESNWYSSHLQQINEIEQEPVLVCVAVDRVERKPVELNFLMTDNLWLLKYGKHVLLRGRGLN